MAAAKEDPWDEIRKIIECCICFEVFKEPLTLPCTHTFCKACVENSPGVVHDGQEGIHCPLCREFHKQGEYVSSFLINQFLDLNNRNHGPTSKCALCCDEHVEWRCLNCKLNMCEVCQKVHSRTPMSKDHKFQACIAEVNSTLDEVFNCNDHEGKELELYCVVCQ